MSIWMTCTRRYDNLEQNKCLSNICRAFASKLRLTSLTHFLGLTTMAEVVPELSRSSSQVHGPLRHCLLCRARLTSTYTLPLSLHTAHSQAHSELRLLRTHLGVGFCNFDTHYRNQHSELFLVTLVSSWSSMGNQNPSLVRRWLKTLICGLYHLEDDSANT